MKRAVSLALSILLPLTLFPIFLREGALPRLLDNDRGLPFLAAAALGVCWSRWVGAQPEDVPLLSVVRRLLAWGASHPGRWRALLGILAGALFFGAAFHRHLALRTSAFDLGIFDQAVWSVAHGRGLTTTLKSYGSLLGDHFEPILYLFSPLNWIWDNPAGLLGLQSLALASAVWPLSRMANRLFGKEALAALFPLLLLTYLPFRSLALLDFHPEAFSVPALLWALDGLLMGRNGRFAVGCLICCLCKESGCATVAALGGSVAVFGPPSDRVTTSARASGQRWWGFGVGLGAALLFGLALELILPHFRGGATVYLNRYGYLGSAGPLDLLLAPLRHPWIVLTHLIWPLSKIEYLARLLLPLAFLPLLAPRWLLPTLPVLLMNLLADYPKMQSIHNQYNAELIPLLFFAALEGARRWAGPAKPQLALVLLCCALGFWGSGEPFSELASPISARSQTMERELAALPRDASVAAQLDLFPHLSHRSQVTLLPDLGSRGEPDYAAFDFAAPLPSWNTSPAENRAQAAQLTAEGYRSVANAPDFLLLKRPDAQPPSEVAPPPP